MTYVVQSQDPTNNEPEERGWTNSFELAVSMFDVAVRTYSGVRMIGREYVYGQGTVDAPMAEWRWEKKA